MSKIETFEKYDYLSVARLRWNLLRQYNLKIYLRLSLQQNLGFSSKNIIAFKSIRLRYCCLKIDIFTFIVIVSWGNIDNKIWWYLISQEIYSNRKLKDKLIKSHYTSNELWFIEFFLCVVWIKRSFLKMQVFSFDMNNNPFRWYWVWYTINKRNSVWLIFELCYDFLHAQSVLYSNIKMNMF